MQELDLTCLTAVKSVLEEENKTLSNIKSDIRLRPI